MPRRRRHSNKRTPCRRRSRGIGIAGADRVEIEIRKYDIERREEGRVQVRRRRDRVAHRDRDLQIEPIEPLQSIGVGQAAVQRRHDVDSLLNGCGTAARCEITQHWWVPFLDGRTRVAARAGPWRPPCHARRRDLRSSEGPGRRCHTPTTTSVWPRHACADPDTP